MCRMSAMLSARKTTDTESDSFQSITNNVTCFLDTAATTADPAKMEDKHGLGIKGIANFLGYSRYFLVFWSFSNSFWFHLIVDLSMAMAGF